MSQKIYKIIPLEEDRVKSIENNQIWFSKANAFNDPFDCAIEPYLSQDLERDNLRGKLQELIWHANIFDGVIYSNFLSDKNHDRNFKTHAEVCGRMKEIGVSSFLSSPTNILTWSHYGNSHKGICLEYDVQWGKEGMERSKNGFSIHEVSYTNKLPFCKWSDFLSAPEFCIETLLCTKFTDWAYENEVRIISRKHPGDDLFSLDTLRLSLSSVFIGNNTDKSSALYKRVISHCSKNNIEVVNLAKDKFRFRLRKIT